MKKGSIAAMVILAAFSCATAGFSDTMKGAKIDGKDEFKEHCSICHPEGGNIVNARKTLSKKDR
jgi:cytochrome c6